MTERDKNGKFVKGHIRIGGKLWEKGQKPWCTGKKLTEAHKEKLKQFHLKNPNRYWLGKKRPEVVKWLGDANRGRKFTEEHKKKIGLALKGRPSVNKGRKLSKEIKEKIASRTPNGSNSRLWRGGITPLTKAIRMGFEYRQWRSDIFTRDNFTCVLCNKKGGYLEADHYPKGFAEIFYEYKIKTLEEAIECEEFWNINNGRTLCLDCHKKTDNYAGKHNKGNHNL